MNPNKLKGKQTNTHTHTQNGTWTCLTMKLMRCEQLLFRSMCFQLIVMIIQTVFMQPTKKKPDDSLPLYLWRKQLENAAFFKRINTKYLRAHTMSKDNIIWTSPMYFLSILKIHFQKLVLWQ